MTFGLDPVKVPGNSSYTADQMWAEPDLENAIRAMRAVVAERDAAVERAGRLKAFVRGRFSAAAITARMLKILAEFA